MSSSDSCVYKLFLSLVNTTGLLTCEYPVICQICNFSFLVMDSSLHLTRKLLSHTAAKSFLRLILSIFHPNILFTSGLASSANFHLIYFGV